MRIYISGPYTNDTESGKAANVEKARKVAMAAMQRGLSVLCPHTMSFPMEKDMSWAPEQWVAHDLPWVDACEGMIVLPGHEDSKGALKEIEEAKALGVRLYYICARGDIWAIPMPDQYGNVGVVFINV